MTAATSQPDVLALLDQLDALVSPKDCLPWQVDVSDVSDAAVLDCRGAEIASVGPADAALIVAAVNRLPELTAALRAVHALAEELAAPDPSGFTSAQDMYRMRLADRIRTVLTALTTDTSGETP